MAAIVQELFRFGFYKRNQGRIARQATFGALATIVALGCWRLSLYLSGFFGPESTMTPAQQNWIVYFIPLVVLGVGLWASFRVVQLPTFADFLISVEGEMNKVSWPSRGELFRASAVVIGVIFFLAMILYAYDTALLFILKGLDVAVKWMLG